MVIFFINLFQEDSGKSKRFKIVTWVVLVIVIISNFAENFLYPISFLLDQWALGYNLEQ